MSLLVVLILMGHYPSRRGGAVLLRQQPFVLFLLPLWLFKGGKARLKADVAARVDFPMQLSSKR